MSHSSLETEFAADRSVWDLTSAQPGKWFRPQCACIEYIRERLANGEFAELQPLWDEFKARDHRAIAAKKFPRDQFDLSALPDESSKQAWLDRTRERCAATMRGLVATIDAAIEIARVGWPSGDTRPTSIGDRLNEATRAYQSAWGLAPGGSALPQTTQGFPLDRPRALQAMIDAVGWDEGSAPAWLAVHRLLDYLLTGAPADSRTASVEPSTQGVPTGATPAALPGSPANPVRARVLLAGRYGGLMCDLAVATQAEGPRSWYVDPVQLGLTVLQPEFIDSLHLAWHACRDIQRQAPALRLAPAFFDAPSIDGPSAGAVFACAMVAAIVGEPLNMDASASVALGLRKGRKLGDGQPIRLSDIELGNVGSLRDKFQAAFDGRKGVPGRIPSAASLRKVVLTQEQALEAIVNRRHESASGATITVAPASTLDDVYRHLTSNAQIERVLEIYAQGVRADWDRTWTDPDSERGSLLYYVPPGYRLFDRQTGKRDVELFVQLHEAATGEDGRHQLTHVDVDLPNEEDTLVKLLKEAGDRLCLSEGPGAGKTTFTRRLRAFLCGPRARAELAVGGSLLALRWEESAESSDAEWPTDFAAAIAKQLEPACQDAHNGTTPAQVAAYALRSGIVVLILDALDQAAPARVAQFHEFLKQVRTNKWRVRVVLTGRTYAVDAIKQQLAHVGDWRFGAVLPFDRRRQHAYLYGPVSDTGSNDPWSKRPLDEGVIRRLVSELPPDADDDARLEALTTLVEFYPEVEDLLGNPNSLFMVRRLAEQGKLANFQTRTELYCQTSRFLLSRAARKLRRWPTDATPVETPEHSVVLSDVVRWETILAATAFTMMATRPGHFRVSNQVDIAELRKAAASKIAEPPTSREWQLTEQVAQLTSRSLLYSSSEQVLAWPDRRMMEFYCGLHLARNHQPGWVQDPGESQGPPRCGDRTVQAHAADPDWHEAFKFALEMPTSVRHDSILLASLAELYEPVPERKLKRDEGPWLRPTELMYRAWCLLEELPAHERALRSPKLLEGGGRVLAAFRRQFERQLRAEGEVGRVAREVDQGFVPVKPLDNQSLALTAPQRISLASFLLGKTAVTREQYALFDKAYLELNQKRFKGYQDKSLCCPATYLNWYDAWCMSRWVGGRLPTEAEWEHACGAESRKRYCRITAPDHPDGYRDLDSDAELKLVADFGRPWREGPRAVGGLQPNAFGLYDMHGGVWEWCASWWIKREEYAALSGDSAKNPTGPERGSHRVFRGGSWGNDAVYCRAAARFRSVPSYRGVNRGFRLARVREVEPGPAPGRVEGAGA